MISTFDLKVTVNDNLMMVQVDREENGVIHTFEFTLDQNEERKNPLDSITTMLRCKALLEIMDRISLLSQTCKIHEEKAQNI